MEITLPKVPIKATHKSPKNLIIFSKPKIGKSEALAQLPNALLIDLEEGSDFFDAMKVKASSINELFAIGKQIKAENCPYDYIILDTVSKLEEYCVDYAEILYSKTTQGKNWFKRDATGNLTKDSGKVLTGSILNLSMGAGYAYHREAMSKVIEYFKTLTPRLILVAHVKDSSINKDGNDFTVADLQLTGKIKYMLTSSSDAIGFMYRKGADTNILSFVTSDFVSCGARPQHLRNAEIEISKMTKEGLVTYWDKVYID